MIYNHVDLIYIYIQFILHVFCYNRIFSTSLIEFKICNISMNDLVHVLYKEKNLASFILNFVKINIKMFAITKCNSI